MNQPPKFTLYNASAGSGKTFTLVKEYLRLLLSAKDPGAYRHMLAITFTNKAVAEMKQRVVKNLELFSRPESIENPPEMMQLISTEIGVSVSELCERAEKALHHLLHHYAGFGIETIDRFNHQLIRTFSRDLRLDTNFEVTLESNTLLERAVDQLISKAGNDHMITETLVDFALEKADDDLSWDISKDIVKAGKILLNENEIDHVAFLKQRSLDDFRSFKQKLWKQREQLNKDIIRNAEEFLQLIADAGLEAGDFMRSSVPNYFSALLMGTYNERYDAKWQANFDETPLYSKGTAKKDPSIAERIDAIAPEIAERFSRSKYQVLERKRISAILKMITPLSVIHLVQKELDSILEEENILPIAKFNQLIHNEVRDQPAPFIYERLGERYRNFFIDEFQDTSYLQWENLIPLIDNALSQQDHAAKSNSLLLVGDAKQSIYRWRGGLPEQFINLYGETNPFQASKKVENLETNYRSAQKIIEFNNSFFTSSASFLGNIQHTDLYEVGNRQNTHKKEEGYVKIEFIEPTDDKDQTYAEKVHQTILETRAAGWQYADICILTRTRDQGVKLGTYLLEEGIEVVSSDTLLIKNSKQVELLVATMQWHLQPSNQEGMIRFLDLLHDHLNLSIAKHDLFTRFLTSSSSSAELFQHYSVDLDTEELDKRTLYESFEYLIRQLKLSQVADAYLFSFMDFVHEFEQQARSGKHSFLEHWEQKKASTVIATSEGGNAVRIMTIHKSKGLEFPIVIFPYADMSLKDSKDHYWVSCDDESFSTVPMTPYTAMEQHRDEDAALCEEHIHTAQLDNFNLLYVTLTRAVSQLYIFAQLPKKDNFGQPKNVNHLLGAYIHEKGAWHLDLRIYEEGIFEAPQGDQRNGDQLHNASSLDFVSSSPADHHLTITSQKAQLWDNEIAEAIDYGNLLHDTMAEISCSQEVPHAIKRMRKRAVLTDPQCVYLEETISKIISHPELYPLFQGDGHVKLESDIITNYGAILRPDRINFQDNSVIITDYKTGAPRIEHKDQIENYGAALRDMGYIVDKLLLVYISETHVLVNNV